MAEPSADTIMEEREELMVSPLGSDPTLRTAHFLKPTVTSIKNIPLSPPSKPTICDIKKTPLQVKFRGRRYPQKRWKTWVDRLLPTCHQLWKKAGIYESILASTYQTLRDNDLIIGLAERWCVETNTFIFPWAEATVTLEDMMVLGGYSVLGDPVSSPLKTEELIKIEENLSKAHRDIRLTSGRFVGQYSWMDHFMESGGQLEHEAFLVLWLSRYVFPTNYDTVGRIVFPVAIHLSRGTPIALAPAVLATIYRDLSLLKKSIIASLKLGSCKREGDGFTVDLWAPFQLVQLWAWERFPVLRPKANLIKVGEPRSARWHRLKRLKVENVRRAMDSAGECFQWRPYAIVVNNWVFNKFYRENEEWVFVESGMEKELESFARCLRASELVGLDCIEQYLPHRVAMQFGMDQDVPGYVPRCNESLEAAWINYTRPIRDKKLYIPPRLFESDVSSRYFDWKIRSMLASEDAIKGITRQRRSNTKGRQPHASWGKKEDNQVFVPPDFASKCKRVEAGYCVEEDKLTVTELLRRNKKQKSIEEGQEGDGKPLPAINFQSSSSSDLHNGALRKMEELMKPVEMNSQGKAILERPKTAIEDANITKANSPLVSIDNNEEEISTCGMLETLGLNLEARITKLEILIARLKEAKFGYGV